MYQEKQTLKGWLSLTKKDRYAAALKELAGEALCTGAGLEKQKHTRN